MKSNPSDSSSGVGADGQTVPNAMILSIAVGVAVLILWAAIAKVDVITTIPGHLTPEGNITIVQAPEASIVKSIRIVEGARVRAGEILFDLDPTIAEADNNGNIAKQQISISRLGRLLSETSDRKVLKVRNGTNESSDAVQASLGRERMAKLRSQVEDIDRQIDKGRSDLDSVQAEIDIASAEVGATKRRISKLEPLVNESVSEKDFDDLKDQLRKALLTVDLKQASFSSGEANLRSLEARRQVLIRDHSVEVLNGISEQQEALSAADEAIAKSAHLLQVKQIVSPSEGVVQRLGIHTTGEILGAGQTVASIVPDGSPLIVEARASVAEAGFIQKGQSVDVKVDTYPYVKYGTLPGVVLWISPDSDNGSSKGSDDKNELDSSSSREGYTVHISVNVQEFRRRNGDKLPVTSGMSVHADIITENRTILEFFLSPISKAIRESASLR